MAGLNPRILLWARETAGLSLDEAADSLHLSTRKQSGPEILAAYENGEREPSRPLLLKFAKLYKRPLLTFYLSTPPAKANRGEDFRTLPEERKQENAGVVDALVRDVHVRQQLVRSVLEDADEAQPLPFIGTLNIETDVITASQKLQAIIGFEIQAFRKKKSANDAFSYARQLVEKTGVFVLLIGNLGSHHTNINPQVFRGFALSDRIAPFIVVNDQDAVTAWAFTLMHEYVHLLLGLTGISGGGYDKKIERFCNDVASQLLLPSKELLEWKPNLDSRESLLKEINDFAGARRISRSLVIYRLYLSGRVDEATWKSTSQTFADQWLAEKAQQKEKSRATASSGPDYYVVRRHRVGAALVSLVRRTLAEGVITPTKAGRVLGVKPMNVEPLLAPA